MSILRIFYLIVGLAFLVCSVLLGTSASRQCGIMPYLGSVLLFALGVIFTGTSIFQAERFKD